MSFYNELSSEFEFLLRTFYNEWVPITSFFVQILSPLYPPPTVSENMFQFQSHFRVGRINCYNYLWCFCFLFQMDVDVGLSSPNKRVHDYSDVLTKNPRKMARIEKVLKAQGECEYRPFSLDGEDFFTREDQPCWKPKEDGLFLKLLGFIFGIQTHSDMGELKTLFRDALIKPLMEDGR